MTANRPATPAEVREIINPPSDNLRGVEDGIRYHLIELSDLRDAGARLLAREGRSKREVAVWLIEHGATGEDARTAAERVIDEILAPEPAR